MEKLENFSYFKNTKKLPKESIEIGSTKYSYLWGQAALFYFNGAEKYKSTDYFGYPKKCWSRNAMKNIAGQIANEMKGENAGMPIHTHSLVHVFQSLCLFHFEINSFEMIDVKSKIIKVIAAHMIDHECLIVYFKIQ